MVAELFRVPRPLVTDANYRNHGSNRGPTLPLRPIPGREGDIDVEWIAGHRDGSFSARRYVQHTDALDRLGRAQAGHRSLKPISAGLRELDGGDGPLSIVASD